MAAAPPLPKQLAVAVYNNHFHDTRTGLAGHSRVPNHPLRKGKENVPSPRKKRETRKAKANPVPQHAARLARPSPMASPAPTRASPPPPSPPVLSPAPSKTMAELVAKVKVLDYRPATPARASRQRFRSRARFRYHRYLGSRHSSQPRTGSCCVSRFISRSSQRDGLNPRYAYSLRPRSSSPCRSRSNPCCCLRSRSSSSPHQGSSPHHGYSPCLHPSSSLLSRSSIRHRCEGLRSRTILSLPSQHVRPVQPPLQPKHAL